MAMLKKYREETAKYREENVALKKRDPLHDPEYAKYKATQRLSAEKKYAKSFVKDILLTEKGQTRLLEFGTEAFGVMLRDIIVELIQFAEHDFSKQALQHVLMESEKDIVEDLQNAFSKKGNGVPSLTKDYAKWILENVINALPDFERLDLIAEEQGVVVSHLETELPDCHEKVTFDNSLDFGSADENEDDDDDDETYTPPKLGALPPPNSEKKTRGRPAKDEKQQPSKRAKKTKE